MNAHFQVEEQSNKAPNVPAPAPKRYPNGIIEIRIADLEKYGKALGIGMEDAVSLPLQLPMSDIDSFNYVVTDIGAEVEILVARVSYIDVEGGANREDITEEIEKPGDILKQSILRRLYTGEANVCGVMHVDQAGRLWMDVMPSDDIEATLVLWLQPRFMGVELSIIDPETKARLTCCRISFNGSSVYYIPVNMNKNVRLS